jgi:hypothetical protein
MIEINNICPHCGCSLVPCIGGEECTACFHYEETPVVVVHLDRPIMWGIS